ncbi:transcriptional regulator [Bradyrhizobium guangdongense]|nr:transcriptional regulator [Bradyrhizobium guangdongense]
MPRLKVTKHGHVTLPADVLEHLCVRPGDALVATELPNGRIELRARPTGKISDAFGYLSDKRRGRSLSIAEINKLTTLGWAGKR